MSAAFEIPVGVNPAMLAGADLSSSQFLGVTLSSGKAVVQTSQGGAIIGVLQNNPKANLPCAIMFAGITKMVAGAALATPGTAVMVDTAGKAIAQTGSNVTIGRTLTAANSGELVTVQLITN
jgi:hypothetical protein